MIRFNPLVFLLVLLVPISCQKEEVSPKTGKLEISFSQSETSSGGRIKSDISSLLVSIKNDAGDFVYEREHISLFKFGEEYLSEPIALTAGSFTLTEFIALDESNAALYATPLEGSPLAYLVEDPLPIGFSITKDHTTKVSPEVIKIEGETSVDFGYATFGLDIVPTFTFSAGIMTYNPVSGNFELTPAHMEISSGEETLYNMDLEGVTNSIRVQEGFDHYTVHATRDGFLPYEKTFTEDELKEFISPLPLVITLLAESVSHGLIAWYPFNGNAEDQTVNGFHGTVHEATLTTDRKGNTDAAYSFDGLNDYIAVAHDEALNLAGDFTISLWTNIASDQEPENGINDILRKWEGDAAGYPFSISYLNPLADDFHEDKILYARYDGQICDNSAIGYSPVIDNDTFIHLVLVRDGDKIRNYLNNVLIEEVTDPVSCSIENTADMTIGCRANLVRFFKGKIDDIRIYNRALTQTEIANLNAE